MNRNGRNGHVMHGQKFIPFITLFDLHNHGMMDSFASIVLFHI